MTYSEKLRDPRWQKKRLQVMERDDFSCACCQSRTRTLNVHHTYYRKGAMPWDYPSGDLVTMCEDCHEELEGRLPLLLKMIRTPELALFATEIIRAATSHKIGMEWMMELCPVIDRLNEAWAFRDQGDYGKACDSANQALSVADYLHDCIHGLTSPLLAPSLDWLIDNAPTTAEENNRE
jgi:hypothetical protein